MSLASPYMHALFPAPKTNEVFETRNIVSALIAVESAYYDVMTESDGALTQILERRELDYEALSAAVAKDGVIVPAFEMALRAEIESAGIESADFHKGMTSQDVVDTGNALLFGQINLFYEAELQMILKALDALIERDGENFMMARTRMQAALEFEAKNRLQTWKHGVEDIAQALRILRPQIEVISLGGPVGDGRAWDEDFSKISDAFAKKLGLHSQKYVWHSLRSQVQDYANWLSKASGICGKIGQDIALMAQQGVDEIKISGGGVSSAMAHKSNPILAETLVGLGRYNAGLLGVMAQATLHEQERSGAAWTIEWLTLPQMLATTEASLRNTSQLLANVTLIGKVGET